mmetsp:Transcript_35875/g.36328  ORF Transcript_35875/g.36328 Transcript_35875/m.36328 type:complete len:172 (+) Transcript_35875:615-1130(+)
MIATLPTTFSRQLLLQQKLMLFSNDNSEKDDMNDITSPEHYSVTGFTSNKRRRKRRASLVVDCIHEHRRSFLRSYSSSLEIIIEEEQEHQHQQESDQCEDENETDDENDHGDDAFSSFSPTSTTDFCLSQRRMKKSKSVSSSLSSLSLLFNDYNGVNENVHHGIHFTAKSA